MTESRSAAQLTVVFTDVEQSSALWDRLKDDFHSVLARHDAIIRASLTRAGGAEVKTQGDGFMLVFADPVAAVAFAEEAQRALREENWPPAVGRLRVRIGMHTGQPLQATGPDGHHDYYGPVVNRAARVADAGHGGQVLLSAATAEAVVPALPPGLGLRSMGRHRLRGLDESEEILQLTCDDETDDHFPPLRTLDSHTHNLPVQLTSFVGREGELQQLADLLDASGPRLVTLLGPGGVGKTRLALQAAADSTTRFADGVWFVDLAEITDAGHVPQRVAAAIGLRGDDPAGEVARYLERREVLLLLDNAEQVSGLSSVLAGLLRAAPRVRCLVTSRTVLHAPGEHVVELGALPVPEADTPPSALPAFASVALLLERAQAAGARVELNAQTAAPLAQLCRHLDGIPLAIELAASRLRHFPPAELLRRLDRRFELLVSRHPDIPERQRTLRGVLEWSHDLLAPGLQALLAQLSVFRGTFSPDAVAEVCGTDDPWTDLADLSDQSLLQRQPGEWEMRYAMLESVREFAAGQLATEVTANLRRRHAEVYLERATRLDREAGGTDEAAAFDELDGDLENMRAGMAFSQEAGAPLEVAGYAAAMATFMWRRGYWLELAEWFGAGRQALAALAEPPPGLVARLLYANTAVALDRGDLPLAETTCAEGLRAARADADGGREAMFLNLAGILQRRRGAAADARATLEEGLARARASAERRAEGMALHNLALLAQDTGDMAAARRLYEEALPVRRAAGDARGAAETLNNLGIIAELEGQLQEGADCFRQVTAAYLQLHDIQGIAVSLCNLGEVLTLLGSPAPAAVLLQAAARALAELESVHAAAAREMLDAACVNAAAPPPPQLPWRRALLDAARDALS